MLRGVATAVSLLALVSVAAAGSAAAANGEAACRKGEIRVHDEAVFGHFSTLAAAKRLRARAAKVGFAGIKIENEGCGDFEVEIDGADTQAQRTSFALEAQKAGFQVSFEQTAPPLAFKEKQVVGIFGSKTTLASANALMHHLAATGFRYIDVARTATRWLVVMPQVPIKQALPIAHEAATAGLHVQFRPGSKT
jgi:hypothetical protein